jgi:diaminopropionate ammonia-lyase
VTGRFFVSTGDTLGADGGAHTRDPLEFHRRLPGYRPTPLIDAPSLADSLGVGQVLVKDESSRLGLPAFKMLGASWASYRAVVDRLGGNIGPWSTVDELAEQVAALKPFKLAAATDGNHGRAVARMAALMGFDADIYVPAGTAQARTDAIKSEGASCTVVDGNYDDAIARSAEEAGERCLVISDTSWPGYVDIPRWVIQGYGSIFWEVEDQLAERGETTPDIVVVQMGVGALAAAVCGHYRRADAPSRPRLLGVEPLSADCILESMEAGDIITIDGAQDSIMAGLNCGTPSLLAWPLVSTAIDVYGAVDDDRAREGMRQFAAAGVVAGETGAAGLAGLIELTQSADAEPARKALGLDESARVLVICTEGATDPENYEQIVGRPASAVGSASVATT